MAKEARLEALRQATDPAQKAAVAIEHLVPQAGQEVLRAALTVLVRHPLPAARGRLRDLFVYLADQGVARDPGTFVRSQILRALRPMALPDDRDLLLRAVMTYEYPAPSFKEEAALLRAGAVVALADLDEELARFHATRLLADERTDPMSGEPALTAVEVLGTLGELLPLWFYAMQGEERVVGEVGSECLRRLTGLPSALLPAVVERYREGRRAVLLVGLVDLLIGHPAGDEYADLLAGLLQRPPDEDLYRYLAAALLASGRQDLHDLLVAAARAEQNPARVAILLGILGDAGGAPWGEVAERLRTRRRR
jgi:hypothetical protein